MSNKSSSSSIPNGSSKADTSNRDFHTLRIRFPVECCIVLCLRPLASVEAWSSEVRNATIWMQDEGIKPRWILMDRDTKFSVHFRHFWKSMGIEAERLPARSPDMNAYCEAFVGRLKAESLNHFVVFSLRQMASGEPNDTLIKPSLFSAQNQVATR